MVGMAATTRRAARGRPRVEGITAKILEATFALISEAGIGAVTMDAVAARSGVSKPTIYRRWATKQDLVVAAIGLRVSEVSVPDLGGFRAEVHWLLSSRLEMYRTTGGGRLIAGLVGAAAEDEAFREAARRGTAILMRETRHVIQRGIDRGDVRPDADAPTLATMIAAPLVFRQIVEQGTIDGALVDGVVDAIVRAATP
jgi:AcrR family transcriptional regulator